MKHQYLVRCIEHQGHWDVLIPAINLWTTVYAKDQIAATAQEMLAGQGAQKFRVSLEDVPANSKQACLPDYDGLTRWHPTARLYRLHRAPVHRTSLAGGGSGER